jgi:ABC-type nitrate/sulfonate/bicarbonate transport system substrate-binding protein
MTRPTIDPAIGRREFCLSLGAGMTILAVPAASVAADLKKVPTSTGIDAVFVPFVVAADRQIFEKHGLEASYKAFDDGNVALDAVLTGTSDIGSTSELGGLARWDKGAKLYVTSILITSKEQIGITAREEIKKPEDLIGKTVGYPRASAGHYYFGRYVKKYKLPMDQIKVKFLQAPEMVAALSRHDIDAFFLWEPWHTKAVALVTGATFLLGRGMTRSTR